MFMFDLCLPFLFTSPQPLNLELKPLLQPSTTSSTDVVVGDSPTAPDDAGANSSPQQQQQQQQRPHTKLLTSPSSVSPFSAFTTADQSGSDEFSPPLPPPHPPLASLPSPHLSPLSADLTMGKYGGGAVKAELRGGAAAAAAAAASFLTTASSLHTKVPIIEHLKTDADPKVQN